VTSFMRDQNAEPVTGIRTAGRETRASGATDGACASFAGCCQPSCQIGFSARPLIIKCLRLLVGPGGLEPPTKRL
jgi:hypothetical protein